MLIVILISVAAVGLMTLGLSLTYIFKGHHIRGEVSSNPDMQRLGLECPAREGDMPKACREACHECKKRELCI